MKSRISARLHKETQRRKNALETSSLPAKLADCRSDDVERTELFIVEGDSRAGHRQAGPQLASYQALLPIRGKILNVQKASVTDMLKNAECAAIIQVIGAGSGRTFDLESARYGKVIIMTDADVDGAHIRTLLLTLFFRYMRPLVEAGRVYAAVPPLHRIEVINAGSQEERGRLHLLRGRDAAHPGVARRKRARSSRSRCSATRASARWTPTSWPRPRWTRATARCGGSPLRDARGGRAGLRAAHGQRRRARARTSSSTSAARARPRAHRRLSQIRLHSEVAAAVAGAPELAEDVVRRPWSGPGGQMSATVDHDEPHVEGEESTELEAGDRPQAAAAVHRRRHPRHRGLRPDRPGGQRGRGAAWAPFIVAFSIALVTAFSYLELVTKYPQAAGAALYTHKAFGIHFVTFLVAFTVMCSGITSASTASQRVRRQPRRRASGSMPSNNTLVLGIALGFMLLVAAVNFRGVGESVKANVVLTLVELSGLLLVIFVGVYADRPAARPTSRR